MSTVAQHLSGLLTLAAKAAGFEATMRMRLGADTLTPLRYGAETK